jgi:hypothetical protein
MKKQEVLNLIYAALTPVLSAKGFRLRKSEQGFFRPLRGGWQNVGIPLWDYKPKFEFSLVMSIRIDEVQNIFNQFGVLPRYHAITTTQDFLLEHFIPKEHTRFKASNENELQIAISRLLPILQDQVIPFLDEHQDLRTLAKAMKLTEIQEFVPFASHAFGPVIVARLIDHPEFHSIVEGYKERIMKLPEPELKKFETLVEYLEKMTPSGQGVDS